MPALSRASRAALTVAVAVALVSGCIGSGCIGSGADGIEPMTLTEIVPGGGVAGQRVEVQLLGRGFFPSTRVSFRGDAASAVDAAFSATVGGVALDGVRFVSPELLVATVPAELAAGTHALEVVRPDGQRATLADAFVVDDDAPDPPPGGRPPRALITLAPAVIEVGATVTLSAAGSSDDGDGALAYAWDFESDGVVDATTEESTHQFNVGGVSVIALRVTDEDGLTGEASARLSVVAPGSITFVTTALDEADPGATPGAPGGSGLSLREALAFTGDGGGAGGTVTFAGPMTIDLNATPLPSVGNGVSLIGRDDVLVAGAGANCIAVSVGAVAVRRLRVRDCQAGILVFDGGAVVSECTVANAQIGIDVADGVAGGSIGPGNVVRFASTAGIRANTGTQVVDNVVHDCTVGVEVADDDVGVIGNVIARGGRAVVVSAAGARILHNTIHGGAAGIDATAATAASLTVVNNIITGTNGRGIAATDSVFLQQARNVFFANSGGACEPCALVDAVAGTDPGYFDVALGDFRVPLDSVAVDAGIDVGIDRAPSSPAPFFGAAPDIGAHEVVQ